VRRQATVLALLGCIVHAMVLPWYAASRLPAHWSAAALAADLAVICHGDAVAAADGATSPAPTQPMPNSECPICKGLVGLQFAILVTAQAGLLERTTGEAHLPPADVSARGHAILVPRNRGPPFAV
jgi:hypothetical protein